MPNLTDKRYLGKICARHPELKGLRHISNQGCIGCQDERIRRRMTVLKLDTLNAYKRTETLCCQECGFSDVRALTLEHVDQDGAADRKQYGQEHKGQHPGGTATYRLLRRQGFPDKHRYCVLCQNCNTIAWIEHKERLRHATV